MVRSCLRWVPVLLALTLCHAAFAETPADRASGHRLPAPFGLGLTLYDQTQDYTVDRLTLALPGIDPTVAADLPVDNRTDSFHLKVDWWALPFLNLYAIGGKLDTTTTVRLGGLDLGLPIRLNDLKIDNDGWVYGGGATLVVGGAGWFASASTTYTTADLDVTDGSVEAWVMTPKIGLVVDRGAVWVGAMYQDTEERHTGTYEIPYLGVVPFDVVLGEATHWSGLLGGTVGLGEHLVLILEAGFGDRQSAMVSLEYRR